MRGTDEQAGTLFSHPNPDAPVPPDHSPWAFRARFWTQLRRRMPGRIA